MKIEIINQFHTECYSELLKYFTPLEYPHTSVYVYIVFTTSRLTRIILRPLSALSLDEGLNSPYDKNASAALWKRELISDDYLPILFLVLYWWWSQDIYFTVLCYFISCFILIMILWHLLFCFMLFHLTRNKIT
jgi:hypothetical protein